jgi:hypothetical protein
LLLDASKGRFAVAQVEIDLPLREHRPPVLDVELALRPGAEGLAVVLASLNGVVRGEPEEVGEAGGVADLGVEIAAALGLAQALRDAAGELAGSPGN